MTLGCGHPAETDAPMQWCERCDMEQPLTPRKAEPERGPAAFGMHNARTGYGVTRRADGPFAPWLGEVTSHNARDSKGRKVTAWKATPHDGRPARMFRTRRAAARWIVNPEPEKDEQ